MSETAAAPVLRFKAGLVDYNEETHIATPVDLKGQITVTRSEEDPSILSFVWEPRGNRIGGNSDRKQELLLFPGDAEWKHIDKCTTGRVFAIKFNSSGEKSFYWLQSAGFDDEPEKLTPDDIKIKETMDKLLDESVLEESEESGPTTSTTTTTSTATTEPQDAEMTEPAKTETDESTR